MIYFIFNFFENLFVKLFTSLEYDRFVYNFRYK